MKAGFEKIERKWWQDKVAYQIYPKSFCDSNGDGIGDLPGVISKLDYLQDLGVDIIWLSPCYKSPMADQGYDISDYYAIDPQFGTMEDMDLLLAEARKRGMYILMDLVVNHCSDEHEWFLNACKDPHGPYGDYFYLSDQKEGLPTNWRSYFGGPAWDKLPGTDMQYLHVFHKRQPDLNWENPKVREEIYKNINWWLEKGLAGFRIDAIMNIKKPLPLKNYPADREDGLAAMTQMLADATGIGEFLQEMKDTTFARYDAFTVGEVCNEKPEEMEEFIGGNGYFSTMFDFNEIMFDHSIKGWYDYCAVTPEDYKKCCFQSQKKIGEMGFLSNIIENHDEPRGVNRYLPEGNRTDEAKKMLGGLYFMLRGVPFIYQGQEIGMENIEIHSIDEIDDISTLGEYQVALEAGLSEEEALKAVAKYSRDNARTPMQWDDTTNAGFTTGNPWSRVNPNCKKINVASQLNDPKSIRSFYKELISLRKNPKYKETIVYGTLTPYLEEQKNLMAYFREGDKKLLIMSNFQAKEQSVNLPEACKEILINNMDSLEMDGCAIRLKGFQYLVLEM